MKSLLTFFFILTFSVSTTAQLDKKTYLINGSGTFSSSKYVFKNTSQGTTQKSTEIDFRITPAVGVFLFDKLPAGLKASISSQKTAGGDVYDNSGNVIASGGSSKVTRFDIGPFARYYFLDKDEQFNLFAEAGYQFGVSKGFSMDVNRNTLFLNGGLEGFFNSSIGLEFTVGYFSRKEVGESSYTQKQNSILFGLGFNFHLTK
ncbi:MAG: hypothetical protein EOO07_15910 [Chitinophagaceae bacterium]|nr:MAG: hypothetical protein EOO07_15910 [Chitinophagaceae bacterium]